MTGGGLKYMNHLNRTINNGSSALIVLSHVEGLRFIDTGKLEYDTVICADAGWKMAQKLGLTPDICIGDYDSSEQPAESLPEDLIRLPAEKDMTDSEAALDLAVARGFRRITIIGGLGGRFDHTMGNLGLLAKYTGKVERICLQDGWNRIFLADPGTHIVRKDGYYYLGTASYGEQVTGLTYRGMKYPLENAVLTNRTTYGGSNEILGEEAEISFRTGRLLISQCNDVPAAIVEAAD
ncbi:thiamine diphosphokinase [Eubacterium pyruvativorans]|uniref:thiamine diphosphokinase n=1 Tax=Eubacterium pyruvativorans TaxID=155865 RepID=UPI000889BCFA|nr:thiamine diphosphokinase [Eubacterium pyruvativorans]SDE54900.1 thiamine pyrophosphokinase [Eubacterium pyruvativorans]